MISRRSLGLLTLGAAGAALLGRDAVGDALADQPCVVTPVPAPSWSLTYIMPAMEYDGFHLEDYERVAFDTELVRLSVKMKYLGAAPYDAKFPFDWLLDVEGYGRFLETKPNGRHPQSTLWNPGFERRVPVVFEVQGPIYRDVPLKQMTLLSSDGTLSLSLYNVK